ncbi:GDSL esterase/lipase At4g10955 [Cryptomeria japonica]|uniref:GDSL esterase/lipase At4g10955 n=1 Tax=Cryptomeria japonica TaxID=3369 RepID=UPI0027DA4972|nr:GDSL esterase/lipase At4g10955 [Cryptomeria japonica]
MAEEDLLDFNAAGPKNTRPNDPNFQRILLACLVNSSYIQEIYRQQAIKRHGTSASAWHTAFHYRLHSLLYSPSDGSIFGAVFMYDSFSALKEFRLFRPENCPSAVIALRGTILSAASIISDLRDDLNLILQQIQKVSRVEEALRVTREMVKRCGAQNVCLAGHSLGAAVALKVSRIMAEEESIFLDTHLFNPPFFSLISVRDQKLGIFIHRIRAMAAGCLTQSAAETRAAFLALQKWCPNLYVNVFDPVSSNYLHYFRARLTNSAHSSIVYWIMRSLGKSPEPHHLLPSANLFINDGGRKEFRFSHGLYQWWSEDTELKTEHYNLDVPEFVDRVNQYAQVAAKEEIESTTLVTSETSSPLPSKATTPPPSTATAFVTSNAVFKFFGVK